MKLAARFDDFPVYALADVPQIKRELVAKGVDVIDLGAGDADLAPPPAAVKALEEAARQGNAHLQIVPYQLFDAAEVKRHSGFAGTSGLIGASGVPRSARISPVLPSANGR